MKNRCSHLVLVSLLAACTLPEGTVQPENPDGTTPPVAQEPVAQAPVEQSPPDTISMPDMIVAEPPPPAQTSNPSVSVGSGGSGVGAASLTNNVKTPQLSEGNCVVVPRPPLKGGGFPAFVVVQATSGETTPRSFGMNLNGRKSVWLSREDNAEKVELLENVDYQLTFKKAAGGVGVSVLQAGKEIWSSVVPRKRVVEATNSKNLYVVRDTTVRDEVDFDTGLGTATLILSTVKP